MIREDPRRPTRIRGKRAFQETNATPASHRRRIVSWISILAFPPLRSGGTTVLVRQRSRGVPLLPVLDAEHDSENMIRRIASLQPCVGQRPSLLKEQAVEEAAMPGQPVRARARFQFPPAIHPRELPAATGVTAIIIRQALRFPRFAAPTLGQNVTTRNRKTFPPCAETVDDRTSLWKPEENCGEIAEKPREHRPEQSLPKCRTSITYTLLNFPEHLAYLVFSQRCAANRVTTVAIFQK